MEIEEVYARFRDIKHGIRTRKKSHSMNYGDHKSSYKGSGYDIVGVDQWRPGQPLKDIAWVLSLRTYPEKLFRIERMEPKELRTLFLLDLSTSVLFQLSKASNIALLMLDLIGNIGLTRSNGRDPVGLLAFSDRVELYVKPKLGSSQIFYMAAQIFEKLKLQREFPERRAANFNASRLKVRHSIIVVSDVVDLVNDRESIDFKLLANLAAKHDMMMLLLDDPDEFSFRSRMGYVRIADMETGRQM